jgi:inner membrane protein
LDSISQVVLGAAVGEAVLGKKIGNRAMLWGAVAGTIPDLDVIGNLFMSEIDSLAFHRGISHSLFFAVLFSFIMASYTRWLYSSGTYRNKKFRIAGAVLAVSFMAIISFGITFVANSLGNSLTGFFLAISAMGITVYLAYRLYKHYISYEPMEVDVSYKEWYLFFFLTIFTHPILDCFTVYGTQLWAPFSNVRVAWSNISVADPLWTFPFALCLVIAAVYSKSQKKRRLWLIMGWLLSSSYMMLTMYNKSRVKRVMEDTLVAQGIAYERFMVNPSILNNILWSGTVETKDTYYQGMYSFFDKEKSFKLIEIPKNTEMVEDDGKDKVLNTLKWFSDGYYAFIRRKDGRIQMNDLRYGSTTSSGKNNENDYVFRFVLEKDDEGNYQLSSADGGPPPGEEQKVFTQLLERIRGI